MSRNETSARSGKRLIPAGLALTLALSALAGCGSSSSSSSSATTATTSSAAAPPSSTSSSAASTTPANAPASPETKLGLSANPEGQLKYNTSSLTAKAGKVSIDFTNMAPLEHNVTIESASGETVGATPSFKGGAKALSLNLKPGTYKFFCSIPGHRQAGMEGTLVVK